MSPVLISLQDISGLTSEELKQVDVKLKTLHVNRGDYIIREGEICKAFYFINYGSCVSSYLSNHGDEVIIDLSLENNWFTDHQGLTSQRPSTINIIAFEECELVMFDIFSFHDLIGISQTYFRLGKLFGNTTNVHIVHHETPEENYRSILSHQPAVLQRFPLRFIASLLGITPETLSRIRARING